MFDLQEKHGCDQISPFHPFYQSNSRRITTRPTDFTFWDDQERKCYENNHNGEENQNTFSPPLWSQDTRNNKSSPRSNNQRYNNACPSPSSRFQAMMEGRKELMEMIANLPESSYELSLKDIVDDQKNYEVAGERVLKHETNQQQKKKKKNSRIMSRIESMDSGVFLLKMFIPTSLGSKKSKISQWSSSFDGSSMKPAVNVEWWKKWYLLGNKNSSTSSSGSMTSTSIQSRYDERKFKPGCWSIDGTFKPRSQGGCLCLFF